MSLTLAKPEETLAPITVAAKDTPRCGLWTSRAWPQRGHMTAGTVGSSATCLDNEVVIPTPLRLMT